MHECMNNRALSARFGARGTSAQGRATRDYRPEHENAARVRYTVRAPPLWGAVGRRSSLLVSSQSALISCALRAVWLSGESAGPPYILD